MKPAAIQFQAVPGGLRFNTDKQSVLQRGVLHCPLPATLYFPLIDVRGLRRELIVQQNEPVLKGQIIARAPSEQTVAIHASSSGRIVLPKNNAANPLICIHTDGQDQRINTSWSAVTTLKNTSTKELISSIRQAGITGMGGAGYPTHLKLLAATQYQAHTLIINAVECDPYTTCDSALLVEALDRVLNGIRIAMQISHVTRCVIALEDQQSSLISSLQHAELTANLNLEIVAVPSIYPSGSEQQLVTRICGVSMNNANTVADVGVICLNVATLKAMADAVFHAEALSERVVTISGPALSYPVNVLARIGTPIADLLSSTGCQPDSTISSIIGGVMMGQLASTESDHAAVLLKETYSIWASREDAREPKEQACINCGDCAYVCPAHLLPQHLHQLASHHRWSDLQQDNRLQACIECGACDLVCPSHIPLTQTFQAGKQKLAQQLLEAQKASHAKQRYEAKQQRLAQQAEQKRQQARSRKSRLNDLQSRIGKIKNAASQLGSSTDQHNNNQQDT